VFAFVVAVMSHKSRVLFIVATFAVQVAYTQQGWFMNQRTIIPYGDVLNQKIYLSGNKVKLQDLGYTLILDISNHEMYFILPHYQSFWKGTFEEFRQGYSSLTLDQINEAVKLVPEKERELYKEFLLDMSNLALEDEVVPSGKTRVSKTGEATRICGYRTDKYQVFSDGELVEEVFIAPALNLGLGYEMSRLHEYIIKLALPFVTNSYVFSKEYLSLLNTGYPMKHIRYNRHVSEINEITEIKRFHPDATAFEPEEDFASITIAELLLLRMKDSFREE